MQPTTPDTDSLTSRRLPSLFLPHGSPPIPIEPCISSEYLSSLASTLPIRPKGIVFVSPHWITEGTFEVSTANKPETIYDFDADTDVEAVEKLRRLSYPTPGAPDLALRVQSLLVSSSLPCATCPSQGLDHGVWTPLYVMFPQADIPVTCLSVKADLDPEEHIRAGRALETLRDEGILVVGSGETVHNVPEMDKGQPTKSWCLAFEEWMEETASLKDGDLAVEKFKEWRSMGPEADKAHPASSPGEHMVPFLVA
eukprot:CAMPEP_0182464530 /NCGR_PEP_ID=MMETSP1319-20130603/8695_1 /TAXON_ID=172717 /ORGANISM="Bolidomonas pacifica, Strain RCC208" /LENGTH=253 /DNA_ID=CAMNT_0024664179 /DNA_START=202 /DNA_END=959 /DNA_ORIENTATION=-